MTEETIYQGIANKDDKAFVYMYRHYFPQIKSLVLKNSGHEDDANDLFQEGIVQLWLNIQKGSFELKDNTKISTYLYTVCRNLWISKLRKNKHSISIEGSGDLANSEEIYDESEEVRRINLIRENFQKLGDKCKQLLTLFYYKKESIRSIAQKMNYEEKTAKNNKYRCMQKLRNYSLNQ